MERSISTKEISSYLELELLKIEPTAVSCFGVS